MKTAFGYRWCCAALAAVSLALCAGCGDDLVTVEGEVTFAGQPVQEGTISFEPADGQGTSTGGKIEGGRYCLSGDAAVQPGKKLVRIIGVRKTGRMIPAGTPAPAGTMVEEMERYIPTNYNTTSKLTCEVTPGETNLHNFNLTKP